MRGLSPYFRGIEFVGSAEVERGADEEGILVRILQRGDLGRSACFQFCAHNGGRRCRKKCTSG